MQCTPKFISSYCLILANLFAVLTLIYITFLWSLLYLILFLIPLLDCFIITIILLNCLFLIIMAFRSKFLEFFSIFCIIISWDLLIYYVFTITHKLIYVNLTGIASIISIIYRSQYIILLNWLITNQSFSALSLL